jgi:mono/diheme cytochrome c family protein
MRVAGWLKRCRALVRPAARLVPFVSVVLVVLSVAPAGGQQARDDADDALTNPFLGDPEAIEAGENLFRRRCVGCHWAPKRGPNLFESEISDEKFLEVVINGRKRALTMPPFGYILSPDEVWQIHAFVKARDRL